MLCNKNECTGCTACLNICPKKAIKMIEDKNGFLYPFIEKNKCIDCKLCERICPILNNDCIKNNLQKIYAGKSKNLKILNTSSSGGIATELVEEFLRNKGIVYGVSFSNKNCVEHIKITKQNESTQLQGSKYVQSNINDTFINVKNDLKKGNKVLFIGTPCQVAGLKKFLKNDLENLYLIDILCHGVPSQKYLFSAIKHYIGKNDFNNIKFRDNNTYIFNILKDNKELVNLKENNSIFIDAFKNSLILRKSCYNCKFKSIDRYSDITLGDFWGLTKETKLYNEKNNGISFIKVSSEKGKTLLENCNKNIDLEEVNINNNILINNQALSKNNKRTLSSKLFYILYPYCGFNITYRITSFKYKLKEKLKNNKSIYNFYKKNKKILEKYGRK